MNKLLTTIIFSWLAYFFIVYKPVEASYPSPAIANIFLMERGGEAETRLAHNQKIAGATPAPATKPTQKLTISTQNHFKSINATVYAYNSIYSQTDDSPCITANGYNLCEDNKPADTVATNCLPFGTVVSIADTSYVVRDRMNKRYGCNVFDVFMKNKSDAINFGKQLLTIKVYDAR